ncbi:MAG TPA: MFS transporter [Propionibacteriaceae bacterium]|nr:MFS transporter [Propionibacteriaceae bacterium]
MGDSRRSHVASPDAVCQYTFASSDSCAGKEFAVASCPRLGGHRLFGLQSLLFYSVLSWLPSIYRDHGYSPAETGLVLSAVTFVQIPVSLLVPRFAARARDQRRYIILSTTLTAVGLAGVLVAPTTMPYLWAMIIGVGLGGSFAIGLLLSFSAADRIRHGAAVGHGADIRLPPGSDWAAAARCRA